MIQDLPDFTTYLPSKVKEVLKNFIGEKLKMADLNWSGAPQYGMPDLWEDLRRNNGDFSPQLSRIAHSCFVESMNLFDQAYPKEKHCEKFYRTVDGVKKYYGQGHSSGLGWSNNSGDLCEHS